MFSGRVNFFAQELKAMCQNYTRMMPLIEK